MKKLPIHLSRDFPNQATLLQSEWMNWNQQKLPMQKQKFFFSVRASHSILSYRFNEMFLLIGVHVCKIEDCLVLFIHISLLQCNSKYNQYNTDLRAWEWFCDVLWLEPELFFIFQEDVMIYLFCFPFINSLLYNRIPHSPSVNCTFHK